MKFTNRIDTYVLGESAIYPGHPVTLALLITYAYPSLAVARKRGERHLLVEEDMRLPGAGGSNRSAVELLCQLSEGAAFNKAVARADEIWARMDDQAMCKTLSARYKAGQAQADKIKPRLQARLVSWLHSCAL